MSVRLPQIKITGPARIHQPVSVVRNRGHLRCMGMLMTKFPKTCAPFAGFGKQEDRC